MYQIVQVLGGERFKTETLTYKENAKDYAMRQAGNAPAARYEVVNTKTGRLAGTALKRPGRSAEWNESTKPEVRTVV